MKPEKASSPRTLSWHLIARHGDLTARVHPGMFVGEDSAGELSFKPGDALIELDIDYGTLAVRAISETHELQIQDRDSTRSILVDPQTQAQVSLPGNKLSIDTSFVTAHPLSAVMQIQVVQTPIVRPAGGTFRTALGPAMAKPHASSTAESGVTAASMLEVTDQAPNEASQHVVEPDIVVTEVLPAESPPVTPVDFPQREDADAIVDEHSNSTSALSKLRESFIVRFAVLATVVIAFSYFFARTQYGNPVVARPDEDPIVNASQFRPSPPAPSENHERLTERLVSEAKPSEDRSGPVLADRVIEQASTTGGAREDAASAMTYVASGEPGTAEADEVRTAAPVHSDPVGATAGVADGATQGSPGNAGPAGQTEPKMVATTADLVQTVTLVEATPQLLDDSPMSDSIAAADDQAVPGSDTQSQVVLPGSLASLEASTISKPVLTPAVSAGSVAAEPELNVGGGLPVADEAPEDDVLESTDSVAFKLDPPSPQLELDTGDPEELLDASAQETQSLYPFSELTIISQKAPIYPRRALPGTSGSVDLEFTVTEAGKVRDVAAQGELPRSFIRAATQALRRWRFEPVLEDGEPVQVRTEVRVTFRG